jgi:uncharacterized protein YsxB (DUF464 family)
MSHEITSSISCLIKVLLQVFRVLIQQKVSGKNKPGFMNIALQKTTKANGKAVEKPSDL